ncbi:MAG: pseudouridine synthase [Proteobacteria bacterium]|jgi:23S rRNA pseudouridine2605 synthase|nr:pseudouridine synthase [Pseudomonadota bacterium]
MKTTRSRRPQPAIAERKASERSAQAAGAGKRTGGKATGEEFTNRNPAYDKPAVTGAKFRSGKTTGEAYSNSSSAYDKPATTGAKPRGGKTNPAYDKPAATGAKPRSGQATGEAFSTRSPAYGKSAVTGVKTNGNPRGKGRPASAGFAEAMPVAGRGGRSGRGVAAESEAPRVPRAPRSKPNPQGGKAERPTFEAYKAVAAAGGLVAADSDSRKIKYKTVSRARRMQLRQGSVKELQMQKELRERRVATTEIPAERLQKALAFTGYGSRRAMEDAIAAGKVSVNGKIAALGSKVKLGDDVRFEGKKVVLKWPDRLPRIVMYHKQEGELVSRDDPEGRVTVFDRLPRLKSSKWVAVGRLDYNTSGLLLFTTSGELANRMMHPSFEVEREYAVRVFGELTPEQMSTMLSGIELEDGNARFARIERRGGEGFNHWYHVILKEGRNREVRRMFEYFGLIVSRLIRIRFGTMNLPGRLRRGQFHELTELEILGIMRWAGLKINGRQADE